MKTTKLIIVGESKVGKTSIIKQIKESYFDELGDIIISCNKSLKNIKVQNKITKFEIWETSAQYFYQNLNYILMRNTKIAILVYDISNKNTFEQLDYWYKKILEYNNDEIIFGIVGNKNDLNKKEVSSEIGKEYADKLNAVFGEISATDYNSVYKIFEELAVEKIKSEKNGFATIKYRNGDVN